MVDSTDSPKEALVFCKFLIHDRHLWLRRNCKFGRQDSEFVLESLSSPQIEEILEPKEASVVLAKGRASA